MVDGKYEQCRNRLLEVYREAAGFGSTRKIRSWSPRQVPDYKYEVVLADDYKEYD